MKKLIIGFITVFLFINLISCAAQTEDASAKFYSAKQKTDQIESFEAEMKVNFSVGEKGGEKTENNSSVHIKLNRDDSGNPVYFTEYKFKVGEDEGESTIYYENGKRYEKATTGEKYFYEMDPQLVNASFENISIDIPQNAFLKSEVSSNKDGGEHIAAKTDTETVKQVLDDFTASVSGQYSPKDDQNSFEYNYSNLKLSVDTNADGLFTNISISFDVSFEHSTGTAEANFDIELIYTNPGQSVSVQAPADLAEYTAAPTDTATDTSTMTEEEQLQMTSDVYTLFDEEHNRVADYDTKYKELCEKYGQSSVDSIVELVEALKNMSE